jgi:hypothetical protein
MTVSTLWGELIVSNRSNARTNLHLQPHLSHPALCSELTSFEGLRSIPDLVLLDIRNCPITSFYGASPQPNLRTFICSNCPLASIPQLILSAVITFGSSLTRVNTTEVSVDIRTLAGSLSAQLRPLICDDQFSIVGRDPVVVIHSITKQRRVVFPSTSPSSGLRTVRSRSIPLPSSWTKFPIESEETIQHYIRTLTANVVDKRVDARVRVKSKNPVDVGEIESVKQGKLPTTYSASGQGTPPRSPPEIGDPRRIKKSPSIESGKDSFTEEQENRDGSGK